MIEPEIYPSNRNGSCINHAHGRSLGSQGQGCVDRFAQPGNVSKFLLNYNNGTPLLFTVQQDVLWLAQPSQFTPFVIQLPILYIIAFV